MFESERERDRKRSSQRRKKKHSFVNFPSFSLSLSSVSTQLTTYKKYTFFFHNGWCGVFKKSISLLILFVGKITLKIVEKSATLDLGLSSWYGVKF